MSLLEQQNLLARLSTEPAFRESFYDDPASVGEENGLSRSEVREFIRIARDEIGFFADSLVWKRYQEAARLLPLTKRSMKGHFRQAFFEFAAGFTPEGIRKHYRDAVEFATYVAEGEGNFGLAASEAARLDMTRLQFFAEGRFFAACRSRSNQPGSVRRSKNRLGFVVWLRVGRQVIHFKI